MLRACPWRVFNLLSDSKFSLKFSLVTRILSNVLMWREFLSFLLFRVTFPYTPLHIAIFPVGFPYTLQSMKYPYSREKSLCVAALLTVELCHYVVRCSDNLTLLTSDLPSHILILKYNLGTWTLQTREPIYLPSCLKG